MGRMLGGCLMAFGGRVSRAGARLVNAGMLLHAVGRHLAPARRTEGA